MLTGIGFRTSFTFQYGKWLLVKCGTAECGMWRVKCGMETVERWCGTVGKMRDAEICVCRRSFVHSYFL